jgi:hypothetical protein
MPAPLDRNNWGMTAFAAKTVATVRYSEGQQGINGT